MKTAYAKRIATIRSDLRQLAVDVRADRNTSASDEKTALRRFGNRLDRADAQLRHAEQETAK